LVEQAGGGPDLVDEVGVEPAALGRLAARVERASPGLQCPTGEGCEHVPLIGADAGDFVGRNAPSFGEADEASALDVLGDVGSDQQAQIPPMSNRVD